MIFRFLDVNSTRQIFRVELEDQVHKLKLSTKIFRLFHVYYMVLLGKTRRVSMRESGGILVNSQKARATRTSPSGVEVFSAFWGLKYANLYRDICLPSVIQSGIFSPDFQMPIRFVIYCPAKDWLEIESDVRAMVDHVGATYNWSDLDHSEFTDDTVLGRKVEIAKFLRGQVRFTDSNDQVLVFAFPDHVFGKGLDRVIQSMELGDYVVCPSARVNLESSTETFKELLIAN